MASTITADGFPDDPHRNIEWARAGTALLRDTVRGLHDDELDAPSRLPGWSRRHVVAHVARNAEALCRLLTWARTGVETLMYPSPQDRDADIMRSAEGEPAALRADLERTAAAFLTACDDLPAEAWRATVRTMQRPIPASVVPWYRVREVWIHSADLDAGVDFRDFPADVSAALVTELTTGLTARQAANLRLIATDSGAEWTVGDGSVQVAARAGELAEWLTGRVKRPEAELPPWI